MEEVKGAMIWRMDWLGLEAERERENAKEEEREEKSLLSERRLGEKGEGGTYRRPWTTETLYIDPKERARRRRTKEKEERKRDDSQRRTIRLSCRCLQNNR